MLYFSDVDLVPKIVVNLYDGDTGLKKPLRMILNGSFHAPIMTSTILSGDVLALNG